MSDPPVDPRNSERGAPAGRPAADAIRLFVALDLGAAARVALHEQAAPLRAALADSVGWVPAANLHLTLRFVGPRPAAFVPRLADGLATAAEVGPAFAMRLAGVGTFPAGSRPRIVWAGVDPSPALLRLHRAVDEAAARCGIPGEDRPFHPHVTLGRVRSGARLDRRAFAAATPTIDVLADIHTVDLMESTLAPTGARYRPLARLALGAPRPAAHVPAR